MAVIRHNQDLSLAAALESSITYDCMVWEVLDYSVGLSVPVPASPRDMQPQSLLTKRVGVAKTLRSLSSDSLTSYALRVMVSFP